MASDLSIIGNLAGGEHSLTDSQKITIYLSFVLWILGYLGIFATLSAIVYMCITGLRLPPRDNRSTYIYINPKNGCNSDSETDSETDSEEVAPLLPRHNKASRPYTCPLQGVYVEPNGHEGVKNGNGGNGGNEGYGSFYNGFRKSAKKRGDGYEADSDEEVVKK